MEKDEFNKVKQMLESGADGARLLEVFGAERLATIIDESVKKYMADITSSLIALLILPPPFQVALVKSLERILLEEETGRHIKWQISMIIGAINDKGAVEDAMAFVCKEVE